MQRKRSIAEGVMAAGEAPSQRSTSDNKDKRRFTGLCASGEVKRLPRYGCGESTHFLKHCPDPVNIECHKCHSKGHIA